LQKVSNTAVQFWQSQQVTRVCSNVQKQKLPNIFPQKQQSWWVRSAHKLPNMHSKNNSRWSTTWLSLSEAIYLVKNMKKKEEIFMNYTERKDKRRIKDFSTVFFSLVMFLCSNNRCSKTIPFFHYLSLSKARLFERGFCPLV
jgi:hypothetical protein